MNSSPPSAAGLCVSPLGQAYIENWVMISYIGSDQPLNTTKDRAYVLPRLKVFSLINSFNMRSSQDLAQEIRSDTYVEYVPRPLNNSFPIFRSVSCVITRRSLFSGLASICCNKRTCVPHLKFLLTPKILSNDQ